MNNKLITAGATLLGVAAGAAAGYLFSVKQFRQRLESSERIIQAAEKEIIEANDRADQAEANLSELEEFETRVNKTGPYETPATAAAHLNRVPEQANVQAYRDATAKSNGGHFNYAGIFDPGVADTEEGEGSTAFPKRVPGAGLDPKDIELLSDDGVRVVKGQTFRRMTNFDELTDEEKAALHEEAEAAAAPYRTLDDEVQQHNVFVNPPPVDGDDVEDELPYDISTAEYMNNDSGYLQSDLVYYEGDQTLADATQGEVIQDVDEKIGEHNLMKFGHKSDNQFELYIRNPRLQLEYSITLSNGTHLKEVLGLDEDQAEPPTTPARVRRRK